MKLSRSMKLFLRIALVVLIVILSIGSRIKTRESDLKNTSINDIGAKDLWRVNLYNSPTNKLALTKNYVVITQYDGDVIAYSKSDGQKVWEVNTKLDLDGRPPVVVGDYIFVGTGPVVSEARKATTIFDGNVIVFNSEGKKISEFEVPKFFGEKMMEIKGERSSGGIIVELSDFDTQRKHVALWDMLNKEIVWKKSIEKDMNKYDLTENYVIVTSWYQFESNVDQAKVSIIDINNGSINWYYWQNRTSFRPLLFDEEKIYVLSSATGDIVGKNLLDGKIAFHVKDYVTIQAATLSDSVLYVIADNSQIVSINKDSGKIIWSNNTCGNLVSQNILTSGNWVYCLRNNSEIVQINAKTGNYEKSISVVGNVLKLVTVDDMLLLDRQVVRNDNQKNYFFRDLYDQASGRRLASTDPDLLQSLKNPNNSHSELAWKWQAITKYYYRELREAGEVYEDGVFYSVAGSNLFAFY